MKDIARRLLRIAMPMKRPADAKREAVRLLVDGSSSGVSIYAVDTAEFLESEGIPAIRKFVRMTSLEDKPYVVGYVSAHRSAVWCANAMVWEVNHSYAERSYGPLLYRVLLSYLVVTPETRSAGWLIPNISEQVSPEALRLWNRMHSDSAFEKIELDAKYQRMFRNGIDDEEALKFAYRIKRPLAYGRLLLPLRDRA